MRREVLVVAVAACAAGVLASTALAIWAPGGSALRPESQVRADVADMPGGCADRSALLFRARGSSEEYGQDKLTRWRDGVGLVLNEAGYRIRDMQAIYSAPGVPSIAETLSRPRLAADYLDAVQQFRTGVRRQLIAAYQRCTKRVILVAGYSQGNILLREVLPGLPRSVRDRIVSVDLVADPSADRRADVAFKHPTDLKGRETEQGVYTFAVGRQLRYPDDLAVRVATYCGQGDIVCDFTRGGVLNAAANAVARWRSKNLHEAYPWEAIGRRAGELAERAVESRAPPTGLILFDTGPHHQIWSVRPDGSDAQLLLQDSEHLIEDPVLAPDGRVLYTIEESLQWLLKDMSGSGADHRHLPVGDAINASPSPDGRHIVFQRPYDGGADTAAIGVASRDGTNARIIRRNELSSYNPVWAGDRIFFGDGVQDPTRPTGWSIHNLASMRPNGSSVRTLLRSRSARINGETIADFDVSANGKWIVFNTGANEGGPLWVMRSDGSDLRSLRLAGGHASLSADGRHIAFHAVGGRTRSLYVAPVDGSQGPRRIWSGQSGVWFINWR